MDGVLREATKYDCPAPFCRGILTRPRNPMGISLVAQNEKRLQFHKVQLFKNTFIYGVLIYNHILISIISAGSTKVRNNLIGYDSTRARLEKIKRMWAVTPLL